MLTSGREFSIEQLKINLVGGPLQSYNFLECKTFFSILIKTNLPSLFIPSPPAASLLFIGYLAGPQGDRSSRVLLWAYIYGVPSYSKPHYLPRNPGDSVVPSLYVDSSPALIQHKSVTRTSHAIVAIIDVFNSRRKMGATSYAPRCWVWMKTQTLHPRGSTSLKPSRTSREV